MGTECRAVILRALDGKVASAALSWAMVLAVTLSVCLFCQGDPSSFANVSMLRMARDQ